MRVLGVWGLTGISVENGLVRTINTGVSPLRRYAPSVEMTRFGGPKNIKDAGSPFGSYVPSVEMTPGSTTEKFKMQSLDCGGARLRSRSHGVSAARSYLRV